MSDPSIARNLPPDDDVLVQAIHPPFRQLAWVEPVDEEVVNLRMLLVRFDPFVNLKDATGAPRSLTLTSVAGAHVIGSVDSHMPREKMAAVCKGHLDDLHRMARDELDRAQAPVISMPASRTLAPPTASFHGPSM